MTKKEQDKQRVLNGGRGGGQAYRRLFEYYENKVANLKKENEELRSQLNGYTKYKEHIIKLEALIEKLKCCENCYYHRFWGNDLGCKLDFDTEFECLKTKSKWRLWEE